MGPATLIAGVISNLQAREIFAQAHRLHLVF